MMNGLQVVPQWRNYFDQPAPQILGVMNAIYPIGKIIGIFPATWLTDKYGRKSSMWIGFVFLLIGAAIQGGSVHIAMFILSRCFLGFATAFLAQPAPILVTELAYPTHRGKVTALYQTFFVRSSSNTIALVSLANKMVKVLWRHLRCLDNVRHPPHQLRPRERHHHQRQAARIRASRDRALAARPTIIRPG
jgi:MFS family permease